MAQTTVLRFWLLALLGPIFAGVTVRAIGLEVTPLTSTLVIALAMFAPLLAAVIIERGWRGVKIDLSRSLDRKLALFLTPLLAGTTWFVASVGLTAIAGSLGITGGLATQAELYEALTELTTEGLPEAESAPPLAVWLLLGIVGGILAGYTINGLLAYCEEYGWRSHLWNAVADRGRFGTIGIVGLLWGLWHSPLILLAGLNYPDHRWAGVFMMVIFTIAASWPMDELRRITGGAVAPAIFHGIINGSASVLVLVSVGDSLLIAPAGLLGAAAMLVPGMVLHLVEKWLPSRPSATLLEPTILH